MKNKYEIRGDTAIIFIDNTEVLVSILDVPIIRSFPNKWFLFKGKYPCGKLNYKRIMMHKLILGDIPKGMVVDHIDRNTLNNTRDNLRIVSYSTNRLNSNLSSNNSSGHRGVTYRSKLDKWEASIELNGKQIYLGTFGTKGEAILARVKAEPIDYK